MRYAVIYSTFHNNTFINYVEGTTPDLDKKPADEIIHLDWDNLNEFYCEKGLLVSFNIWNCKKGRKISFFSNKFLPIGDYADVKEWKTKDLNIIIEKKYFSK